MTAAAGSRDYGAIRRVLIITLVLNWMATIGKLVVGQSTGTLSLSADGLDSFFDGFSNAVGIVGISMASRPPDREHPYGHRKFETIMALGIAMLLAVTTFELVQSAIERFGTPVLPEVNNWSYAALLFGIVVQGSASAYEFRVGRRLHSELLLADARHSAGSMLVSIGVLLALPFVRAGLAWVDPAITLVVAVVIAKLGADILREGLGVLVDRAPLPEESIAGILDTVPGVTSYHRIRSRGASDEAAVDLHVRVEPDLPIARADAIADEVRHRLLHELDGVHDVTVHVEPQKQAPASPADLYAAIQEAAAGRQVSVHEVWAYVNPDGKTRAEAHIGVAPDMTVEEAHALVSEFEAQVKRGAPWLDALHTHIEPAVRHFMPGTTTGPEASAGLREAVRQSVAAIPELQSPSNMFFQSHRRGLVSLVRLRGAGRPVGERQPRAGACSGGTGARAPARGDRRCGAHQASKHARHGPGTRGRGVNGHLEINRE